MELTEIQVSFIWAETIINGFAGLPDPEPPLAFLRERTAFTSFFDQAQQQPMTKKDDALTLIFHPPWRLQQLSPKPAGERFWRAYLENQAPGTVNGKRAWRSLVPFRVELPFKIAPVAATTELHFDVFAYPYGLALAATAKISGSFTLEDAVEAAVKVRRTDKFTIEWSPGNQQTLSLQALANQCLSRLRTWGWGKASAGKQTALDPFTICSVTQGKVDNPAPVAANSDVHRALEALAAWRPNWKTEPLPDIKDARVSAHAAGAETPAAIDWVYGRQRGRVIWIPSRLSPPDGYALSLECYHHNLTYASLQVESLCGFMRETLGRIPAGLTVYEEECARNAAGLLTRLYIADSSIYRSWSVRSQMDQNNFRPLLDELRKALNLPPMTV